MGYDPAKKIRIDGGKDDEETKQEEKPEGKKEVV